MSQYMPEEIQSDQRRAAITADDISAQNIRNAEMQADSIDAARLEENREADTHAAEYLGQDVDEYQTQQLEQRTPVEQYLELGFEQSPTEVLNSANQEARLVAEDTAAANNALAADQASQAAADAVRASELAARNAMAPEPGARNSNDPQLAAEIGKLLYQNGAFLNGGVGGIAQPGADMMHQNAQREGIYTESDPIVEPATAVDETLEIEPKEGADTDGTDPVDDFQRHLQEQARRRKK